MANTKITADNLAANAVNASSIADGVITPAKIASGDFYFDTDTLYIDSTNNRVGIGETSPVTPLHVKMATGKNILFQDALSSAAIKFTTDAGAAYAAGTINASSLAINGDSGGNLAVGGTTPVAKLHVQGSGTAGQVTSSFLLENASSGTAGMDIIGAAGSSRLRFLYGGGPSTGTNTLTEALNIVLEGSSAGNVGIGTSSPDAQLAIYGQGTSTRGLQITATATSGYAEAQFVADSREWRIGSGGSTGIFPNMFYIYDQQGGSGRLLIDSATGDVRLVGGHQMTNALSWWNSTNYELASIENASHPSYNDSGGLVFKTAKTSSGGMAEAMRIDSQQFVGIGTTNPENKLHLMLPTGQNGDILRLSRSSGSYSFKVGVDANSSYYVSNLSSTKIIDANYQGWVTHPQQPHIVFSPRYSGGSGFANYHHEDTTYSRGTLSSTTVAGYARVTVPTAGLYLVTFHSIGDREQNVRRDMQIAVNGGAVATALTEYDTDGFKYRCMTITLDLAANDYLTFSNDDWYDASSGSVTTWRKVSITLIG